MINETLKNRLFIGFACGFFAAIINFIVILQEPELPNNIAMILPIIGTVFSAFGLTVKSFIDGKFDKWNWIYGLGGTIVIWIAVILGVWFKILVM